MDISTNDRKKKEQAELDALNQWFADIKNPFEIC